MPTRTIRLDERYDLALTLGPLQHSGYDPTTRVDDAVFWRALRTKGGPATLRCARVDAGIEATAWGPGADAALDAAPGIVGAFDRPEEYRPAHPLLRELHRRFAGVRLPRTGAIFDALYPAVLEQKVTGREAANSWAALVRRYGEPAPGPGDLMLPPAPKTIAALPYFEFHPLGIERRRADTMRRACARGERLNAAAGVPAEQARTVLRAIPGIGAWTAAEVTRVTHGDPDAISVGDFHLPNIVAWALAGEARGNDDRMLELLEPERGHRARAVRLLEIAGVRAPRFGPRRRLRSISSI